MPGAAERFGVKRLGGGLHEGAAYTSEYGSSISLIYRDCRESAPLFSHCKTPKRPNSEQAWLFKIYCLIDAFKFKGCGSL